MGCALAWADGGFHGLSALAAMTGALLIQAATNIWNDYGDLLRGADTAHRDGPIRITQTGAFAPGTVRRVALLLFAMVLLPGIYLVMRAGWPLLLIGICSIVSGIWYTAGRHPLAYIGLGDLFVLVFFGPVAVGGTYYAQTLHMHPGIPVMGLCPGLLATAILAVNNIRDRESDRAAGKHTLVVRFGPNFGKREYRASVLAPFLIILLYVASTRSYAGTSITLLLLPMALRGIRMVNTRRGRALNPVLAYTARLLALFSLLFLAGLLIHMLQ
jgi:1,4-dihydroxy-2-naphthoate octaprenyltransferase